jgi:hypothetical protein
MEESRLLSKYNQAVLEACNRGYCVNEDGELISPSGGKPKGAINSTGYREINLRERNSRCYLKLRIHKLMAYPKFGDKIFDPDMQVRHLDNNKLNNSWNNIGLGIQSANMMDIPEKERRSHAKLAARARRRLTDDQAQQLRKDKKDGMTHRELCQKYGICKSTVSDIVNYKLYNDTPL